MNLKNSNVFRLKVNKKWVSVIYFKYKYDFYKDGKTMINLNEIKNAIQTKKLINFECETPDDILSDGFKFNTLEELMSFCEIQGINTCFIDAQYTKLKEYLITQELIEEYLNVKSLSLKHRIIDTIRQYNKALIEVDDSNPTEVIIAVLYQSKYFYYYEQEDLLVEGEIILEPEDKMQDILDLFEVELDGERSEYQMKIEEQTKKLEDIILCDPDFKLCTNKELRRNYIRNLFKNMLGNDFKELKSYWTNPDIPAYVYRGAIDLVELLWRKLKYK